jgi:ABC-2 family transporter
VVALLGGISALLLAHGHSMHAAYDDLGLGACANLRSPVCGSAADVFMQRYHSLGDFLPGLFLFLPGLLGAFVGGPVLARELETGTFRFAWTQGTDRTRWIVAKLLLVGGSLLVLATAFSLVFTWWFDPISRFQGRMNSGQAYEVEGTVFIARTLFGFALGALLGVVIRRTVPAVAATLGIWFGAVFLSVVYLRPHIQAPLVAAQSALNRRDQWIISEWFQDRAGRHLSDADINALLGGAVKQVRDVPMDELLRRNGITQMVKYQPDSRFWHFQTVETIGYAVVTLLLGAATVWWVRRRTS